MTPPRLKDIARELNVSVVTVSKVLHNHPDISAGTRERVLKRIKEVNYRPNLAARALVTGRTYNSGLVVPDLVHPFFGQVAKALSAILRKKGYSLVISSSEGDPELENQEIEQLLARRVDVLIIASAQRNAGSFRRIEEQKTPYILIDRKFPGVANFVGSDDKEIGRIAATHLLDIGRKRIAHIGGPKVSTAIGRAKGFQETLAVHGLPAPKEYIVMRAHGDDAGYSSGYSAMKKLLALHPRPDAVFCYNDPTAMGVMEAVIESGLSIPGDVAVVGCGNVIYAKFLRVPLTSIDQQSQQMGEQAAKMALSLLDDRHEVRPRQVLLDPKLIVRASTVSPE